MKKLLFTLVCLIAGASLSRADEVALLQFRIGKEKALHPVAIEFAEGDAPITVANFKKLVRDGFYKGITVHRAFPHMLVQMGDPQSRGKDRATIGTGGPGYTLPPEIRRKHTKGAVAMARLPDKLNPSRVSNGSQFYVCLEPMPNLDGQYTVFGHVLYGMETLDAISARPVDSNDNPTDRIEIRSAKILPREALPPAPQPGPAGAKPARKPWWKIFG